MNKLFQNIATIKLENITKKFGNYLVLDDINFEFKKGNAYALKGVSGTGKSTLINILSGIEFPTLGNIYYDKHNINTLKTDIKRKILQESIGLIFQYPYLIKELTVLENVIIKSLILNNKKENIKEYAIELIEKVGIIDKINKYPNELSGGEQQRVSLARALFTKPDFLIADEPTAHLDEKNKILVLNLLIELQQVHHMGLIITSHDEMITKKLPINIELHEKRLFIKQN